ncbi:MAG: cytidylate kinase-like family protein [Ignavibacteria bacterium]|nr:cytidylate kinase-like family protein [Ignavibacteria bacterium]
MQIVTISRGTLIGAEQLANALSQRLQIPIITREKVIEEGEKYLISETGFTDITFLDRAPSPWERQYYKRKHYLLSFQVALLELILQEGSCIYLGHLAHFLLNDIPFVLRIRVIKSLHNRAKAWQDRNPHLTYEQALDYIRLIDERRRLWGDFLYGVNIEEPKHYDLVINLDKIDPEYFATIVEQILNQPYFNSTEENIKQLNNLLLSSKAKLLLFLAPTTRGFEVDVEGDAETGQISILGLEKEKERKEAIALIQNVLRTEPGIKDIKFV